MKKLVMLILLTFLLSKFTAISQTNTQIDNKKEISLLFGLNQVLFTNGFNFELNYWDNDFVIDYSHGFGLEFKGDLISEEAKNQSLNFEVSQSLGIGLGYRISKGLNLRLEPKLHIWNVYYKDDFEKRDNKISTYNTYTLGLGLYYKWVPFESEDNFLRGLTIAPSFRWWPNVASSLDNNELNYFNNKTNKVEIHKANNIGIANSSFFVNVSIGYTIGI